MIYSDDEKKWLKNYIPGHDSQQTATAFNKKFNRAITPSQIASYRKNNHIPCGVDKKFVKNQKSWNKGKKYSDELRKTIGDRQRKTWYKKGNIPVSTVAIGTIIQRDDGLNWIKIKNPNKWTTVARFMWSEVYGEVPRGYSIIHLNGNKTDDRFENLEMVSKAVLLQLNRFGYITSDIELTKAAIMEIQLRLKLSDYDRHCKNCIYYQGDGKESKFTCNNSNYKSDRTCNYAQRCRGYIERSNNAPGIDG